MSGKVRQAVLRILLLTQEFTREELAEAATLISGQPEEDLLAFLERLERTPHKTANARPIKSKATTNGESRALQGLKSVDEEKYQILRDLEIAIREGAVLAALDEFRAFARTIAKNFNPGKSRKEALGRLMALLVPMDTASIREFIAKIPPKATETDNSFRQLANQILSGTDKRLKGDSQ
jgi:hypothetical protein